VYSQLKKAKGDMELVQGQVTAQYEARLMDSVSKLQQTQKAADTFKAERDEYRKELEKRTADMNETKSKW
jgi:uncharacterized membrane-anchored protein YhcB (DUF1043 family)